MCPMNRQLAGLVPGWRTDRIDMGTGEGLSECVGVASIYPKCRVLGNEFRFAGVQTRQVVHALTVREFGRRFSA